MRPVIGVTPDFNAGDREDMGGREPTYFLRARYVRAIEELGGVPLILPLAADPALRRRLFENLDGVLLTGSGPDLPPSLYGERQRYKFRVMSRQRSEFELEMARLAAERAVPLLGICGGMQTINVALGGSLFQDIPSQIPRALPHRQAKPATALSHPVTVQPGSLLRRIVRRDRIRVNSSHHQSVKQLAPSLTASAVAPDGVIEAIESPHHPFLLGLQWHPEFLFDRHHIHRRLFQAFLKAARGKS
ncbi:MAG: gamma-glutamyl-gamma-aminobutyrate hydrolase [Nitrospiraceae bacterium]|jgi:putative glutamine amidotransferase|nr:MAG: gamma-glutamyl-gamma-aminobutyrate hydrolase [Nitrospiraceae bacterium]